MGGGVFIQILVSDYSMNTWTKCPYMTMVGKMMCSYK